MGSPRKLGILVCGIALLAGLASANAKAQIPSYAHPDSEEIIGGRIATISGQYTLTVRDNRGFLDSVRMHPGTVIIPTGLTLAPGMSVTIRGHASGSVFSASEIDTSYTNWNGYVPGYAPGYAYGGSYWYDGPYWYGPPYGYWNSWTGGWYGGGLAIGFGFGYGYGYGGYGYGHDGYRGGGYGRDRGYGYGHGGSYGNHDGGYGRGGGYGSHGGEYGSRIGGSGHNGGGRGSRR